MSDQCDGCKRELEGSAIITDEGRFCWDCVIIGRVKIDWDRAAKPKPEKEEAQQG